MIYVLRHGQTDWNVAKRTQGSIETELNETGIAQAKNVKEELSDVKLDAVFCSPRKRCKSTAEIVCEGKNVPIVELEDLRERGFGEFEGKQKGVDYDWVELWDWDLNKQYERAENVRDFYKRIVNVIENIKKDYFGKNVLIVTHAGVCGILYCYFNNIKPNGKLKIPGTKNCELVKYDESVECFNVQSDKKLKRRFATNPKDLKIVDDGSLEIRSFNNPDFTGDIALVKFNKMNKPFMVEKKNLCMANDNYKWLEFYDYNSKYKLTAMYNENNENVEWYFDIARKIGKENGIPYEDDLYLDIVVTPNGDLEYLDEDELEDAFNRLEVSKEVYDMAHEKAKELLNRLKENTEKLKIFTDRYLKEML